VAGARVLTEEEKSTGPARLEQGLCRSDLAKQANFIADFLGAQGHGR